MIFLRLSFYVSLCLLGSLLLIKPLPAHAGLLDFLFPSLRTDPHAPREDGLAPFADPKPTPTGETQKSGKPEVDLNRMSISSTPLEKPHRLDAEITNWAEAVTAKALNFSSDDYNVDLQNSSLLFDASGRDQYTVFLREQNMLKVLQTGKYQIRSYVKDTPLLLNEGAVGGRYRWLYRVPVMVSYMPRGLRSYEDVKPINRDLQIDLQIGRKTLEEAEQGIQIERWSGQVIEAAKK